jgi:hypothetical protein
MQNPKSRSNPMIMVAMIVAMILLISAIFMSSSSPGNGVKSVHLASGEWAPYSGESLADKGVASVIIEYVFAQMGYQTQFQFMPWTLAQSRAEQSQRNNQIRGIFPYVYSVQRDSQFYFSDSIIDIPFGVFFHLQHSPEAQHISHHKQLSKFAVITLQGYHYDDEIAEYLPSSTCDLTDTVQGFESLARNPQAIYVSDIEIDEKTIESILNNNQMQRMGLDVNSSLLRNTEISPESVNWLANNPVFLYWLDPIVDANMVIKQLQNYHFILTPQSANLVRFPANTLTCELPNQESAIVNIAYLSKPKVVIEAIDVGERILSSTLPELAPLIQLGKYSRLVPHLVMFPKNNPNNLALRDQFNQRLAELRANQQSYDYLIQNTVNKIQMADAVSLVASSTSKLVRAGVFETDTQSCQFEKPVFFPRGSKALVRQWPSLFLASDHAINSTHIIAKILNGPLAGQATLYCFEPSDIELQ